MIEFTTGLALMASLYVGGNAGIQVIQAPTTSPAVASTTTQKNQREITTNSVYTTLSGTSDSQTSDQIINSKQVERYVREQFKDEPVLVEIARCESTFRQYDKNGNIIRGVVNKGDVGVMQINERYHANEAVKLGLNIYTTEGNVAFAKHLFDKFGSQPWSSSQDCWSTGNSLAMR